MLVRRLAPKLGEFRMALIGSLLMTLGLAAIGMITGQKSLGLLFAVAPLGVIGFSALTPSLLAMLSLRIAADEQGELLGVGQSMSALARIFGPLVGVALFQHGQNRPEIGVALPYWVGASLMLLGVVMVLSLRSPQTSSDETTP